MRRERMNFTTRSERELKRFLRELSDKQLKKLVTGIDVSPFPVLLASEYKRRFGYDESMLKKTRTRIKTQIRQEQKRQWSTLNQIKKDIMIIKNSMVSESGISNLTERSIAQIQNRRIITLENLRRSYETLYKSSRKIEGLENEFISLKE